MIAIAALAVLFGTLRVLAVRYGVCRASVTMKAATVNLGIEAVVMAPRHHDGPDAFLDRDIFADVQDAPGAPPEYVIFDYRVQDEPGAAFDYVIFDDYVLQIPLKSVAVLALAIAAFLALAYHCRGRWTRWPHALRHAEQRA
jgi:hypothetical protein